MDEAIEQLLEWTTSIGVNLNGIHPKALHGRGIGIVATRQLEVSKTCCPWSSMTNIYLLAES